MHLNWEAYVAEVKALSVYYWSNRTKHKHFPSGARYQQLGIHPLSCQGDGQIMTKFGWLMDYSDVSDLFDWLEVLMDYSDRLHLFDWLEVFF